MIELTQVKCSGKMCTSTIGVLNPDPDKKYHCQRSCAGKKETFTMMKETTKKKPVKVPRPRKVKVDKTALYESRKERLEIIKEESGMTLAEIGKSIGVDHASVCRYLSGETNITDKRWEQIEVMV